MKTHKTMPPPNANIARAQPVASHPVAASRKVPLKVALVEDQPKVRESWTRLINSLPDFSCVCACASGEEALRVIPAERPDVILMDIFLTRMSGIECTVRLKEQLPGTQIVILTAMDDQELVFMALEAGADGYLLKRTKPSAPASSAINTSSWSSIAVRITICVPGSCSFRRTVHSMPDMRVRKMSIRITSGRSAGMTRRASSPLAQAQTHEKSGSELISRVQLSRTFGCCSTAHKS